MARALIFGNFMSKKLYIEMSEEEFFEYKQNNVPLVKRSPEELAIALFDVLRNLGAIETSGVETYTGREVTKARLKTARGYDIDLSIVRPMKETQ